MPLFGRKTIEQAVYNGETIPDDSVLFYELGQDDTAYTQGKHDGGAAQATLTDSTKSALWSNDDWNGYTVQNITNGESALVTDSTTTTVVGALSGPETWDDDDDYLIEHATILQDSTKSWTVNEWQNLRLVNSTDGSSGSISSNTATTITVSSLTGGTNNAFRVGDVYNIVIAADVNDIIEYETATNLGGTVSMSVKGIPSINGSNGTHTFSFRVLDASAANDPSDWVLYTATV